MKKTVQIQGMHCQACELLLERKLKQVPGIQNVYASLSTQSVTIDSKDSVTKADILKALDGTGYSIAEKEHTVSKIQYWNSAGIPVILTVLTILWFISVFLEEFGFGAGFQLTDSSSLVAFFIFGLIAGVSSCAALVGGLMLTLSKGWQSKTEPYFLFNSGRIISFMIFGAVLGMVGSAFQMSLSTTAILVSVVSLLMVFVGLQMLNVPFFRSIRLQLPKRLTSYLADETHFAGRFMPAFAGAGTFFLPCGFTLLAQSIALATGNPILSAFMMGAFAFGTLPVLVLMSMGSITFQKNPSFQFVFSTAVATIIIAFGIYTFNSQLLILGVSPFSSNAVVKSAADTSISGIDAEGLGVELTQENGTEVQKVYMRANQFAYYPKTLVMKAGIPTTVRISADNVLGCAQAMYFQGLSTDIVYLNKPESEISFTPKKGTYTISCTMGMVSPVAVTVL